MLIGQLVNLVRDGEPVRMCKRAGTVVTLEDLVEAIGVDAARYALARSSVDQQLDIDLDLLSRQTNDNPVFYVQYAHARIASVLRNAADLGIGLGEPAEVDVALLAHEREGDLLRALGEFPRVVAAAAELRAPHRVARYLEALAGTYHRFYDACRVLPLGDEEATPLTDRPAVAVRGDRASCCQRLALLGVTRSGADVRRARARDRPARSHGRTRGRRCTDRAGRARRAGRSTRSTRASGRGRPSGSTASCTSAAVAGHRAGRRARHARCSSSTRPTSAAGPRDFAGAFAGADVLLRRKAFLCAQVARWLAEEGLRPRRVHRRRARVALAAGFPAERIVVHGNNKSSPSCGAAVDAGVGRIVVDSFDEIDRLLPLTARERRRRPPVPVLVRVTVGVEAHTHEFIATAHEDQKFGFSLRRAATR